MKRVFFLFFAIIMPLMAISSDITTFLGTWKCISSIDIVEGKEISNYMKGHYLQVNADGTYTSTSEEMGKGIYIVQGNSFVAQNESGATFTATISVAGNQLTMEGTSSYGVSFTYYFVKVEEVEEIDVLGTWKCISSSDVVDGKEITNYMKGQYLTANADGTYTSTSEEMGYGTYTLMGNNFTARNNLGVSFTATVFVSGDQLTMEGSSSLGVSFQYIFERSNGEPEPDNPSGDPTKRSIHVAQAGTLSDYINEEEINQIEELTLTGEINGTDFKTIRRMLGAPTELPSNYSEYSDGWGDENMKLRSLDISGVRIVAGGTYLENHEDAACDLHLNESDIIPARVFDGCKNLVSIAIPDNVNFIGSFALRGTAWYDAQPDGLVYLGKVLYAYKGNGIPSNITIEDGILGIAGNAFAGMPIESVTIPESVTRIGGGENPTWGDLSRGFIPYGKGAFYDCDLQEVISMIENPFDIDTTTFSDNTFYNATLYVPAGTIDKYKTADGWKYFYNIIELDPSGINNVKFDGIEKTSVYDLCGRRMNQPQKGINIIRQSDGTIKKVLVK